MIFLRSEDAASRHNGSPASGRSRTAHLGRSRSIVRPLVSACQSAARRTTLGCGQRLSEEFLSTRSDRSDVAGAAASAPPPACVKSAYTRACARLALIAIASLATARALDVAAHDIPGDVRVQAFVKPAAEKLQLL